MLAGARVGLMIWAVVGPMLAGGVAYLSMLAREKIVVAGAVRVARNAEVSLCNEQRLSIGRAINEAIDAGTAEAVAASRAARTPVAPAELLALCTRDPTCRKEARP